MNINALPPPINASSEHPDTAKQVKKQRSSNLELYRIILMLLIIAHHYVVNSGVIQTILSSSLTHVSTAMLLFGAWGKTGINCFVLITGYFMCKQSFSGKKLLRLYLQIVFYALIIFLIFCITGHEHFSVKNLLMTFFPIKSITTGFTSCFLIFYILIPFVNILVKNLDRKLHKTLIWIMLAIYTFLPSFLFVRIGYNYVSWFFVLYLIASYIRFYGLIPAWSHSKWGWVTIGTIALGCLSIFSIAYLTSTTTGSINQPYYLVADSNKILALVISVSAFMWFKDLKIPYSSAINTIGATTFGVFLIHANSDAMRQWLWKECVDSVGHYCNSLLLTLIYAVVSVIVIFAICSMIELFRMKIVEPRILKVIENQCLRWKLRI